MLVLSRKSGQRISIGDQITIVVLECVSGRVKIGIEAPPDVPVYREEIAAIRREFECNESELLKREKPNSQRNLHSSTA